VRRAVFEGFRRGRRAGWLIGADWESLLSEPVEAIRARFGVTPAVYYPRVLPVLRARQAAGQQTMAAAA
jgi:ubiquinone biosynthesis protein COQ4